jgi:hypothetical protein
MSADLDMPCGRCDVGIYSYAAATTPLAHALAEQAPETRRPPRCKTQDRDCVGACHFIDALNRDPEGFEQIKLEMDHER